MQIVRHCHSLSPAVRNRARKTVLALGNFDGVHRGHRAVIAKARAIAEDVGAPLGVMTFEPHPAAVLRPSRPVMRLTRFARKARLLASLDVEWLFVQHFTEAFSHTGAEAFIETLLVGALDVRHVVTGHDFTFGHGRRGNAAMLAEYALRLGFGFSECGPVTDADGMVYSSSAIREALQKGETAAANAMLGYAYAVTGRAVRGSGRGAGLGFATANIPCYSGLELKRGVYAITARIDGGKAVFPGVANLGCRPTFGGGAPVLETHLFEWEGPLYGRRMEVALHDFIRPERTFPGPEALIAQIREDCRAARTVLTQGKKSA